MRRLLVAEDERNLREGIAEAFRDAGHEVVGYKRSGIEALTEIGDTVLATTFSSTTPVRTA